MDALGALVSLLRPHAIQSKVIRGAGRWGVRYPVFGQPSFALILQGPCWLIVDGIPPTALKSGDFVLFPATPGFTLASDLDVTPKVMDPAIFKNPMNEVVHGDSAQAPTVSLLGGYFAFDAINAPMLTGLLPKLLHIRADDPAIESVEPIVELVRRETTQQRSGQSLVLTSLVEIMLVEALRATPSTLHTTGVLAGLRDPQLAVALRCIHTEAAHPWALATLAREAGMSRSSFAERFARVVGMTPLNYLLQWRIAVAKTMMAHEQKSVAETALAVGYQSASGFSTAFSRETGRAPKEFIRRAFEDGAAAATT